MLATPYQTVLFDLDGTLLDSLELIVASYLHVQRQHPELAPRTRAEIPHHVGLTLTATFEGWLGAAATPARVETLVKAYVDYNLAEHDRRVRACAGVPEVVVALDAAGVRLGVVTSKRRKATVMGLRCLGLLEPARFEVLVCADDVGKPKPDPEPVRLALEALGASRAGAVFVGDSVHDIEAGCAAGLDTVAVTWGSGSREALSRAGATTVVSSASELAAALGQRR